MIRVNVFVEGQTEETFVRELLYEPLHGSLIAIDIGLDIIRQQCQHFDKWLTHLEQIIL